MEERVREEAELLQLTAYFEPRIHGGRGDPTQFSKRQVFEQILAEAGIPGSQLVSFGDGPVEIRDTKELGGVSIAVCSDENLHGSGEYDPFKKTTTHRCWRRCRDPRFSRRSYLDATTRRTIANDVATARSGANFTCCLCKRDTVSRAWMTFCLIPMLCKACPVAVAEHIQHCAEKIVAAKRQGRSIMLNYGAHLLRNGTALILDRFMKHGWLTHLATNGAGHHSRLGICVVRCIDRESVEMNVASGTFGTWDETARNIHLALMAGALQDLGYGRSSGNSYHDDGTTLPAPEALQTLIAATPAHRLTAARADYCKHCVRDIFLPGKIESRIVETRLDFGECLATPGSLQRFIPASVTILLRIIPIFNGAVIGRGAELDFKLFGGAVENLDGGVVLSVGSAIMGPQCSRKPSVA